MVELRADGIDIRYCPADLLQHENENIDAGEYCQDLVACAVRVHADRNCNKPLEIFSFSRIMDEYYSDGCIFHGADLYQCLVFQPHVTGT